MSGNNSSDGFSKSRPALGDVTNRLGKRAFSMVSGNSMIKFGDGYAKNLNNEEGDSPLPKQIRLGEENLSKEKRRSDRVESKQSCGLPHSFSGTYAHGENIAPATLNIANVVKQSSDFQDTSVRVARADSSMHRVMKVDSLTGKGLSLFKGKQSCGLMLSCSGNDSRGKKVATATLDKPYSRAETVMPSVMKVGDGLANEKSRSDCAESFLEKGISLSKGKHLLLSCSGTDSRGKNTAPASLNIPNEVEESPKLQDASLPVARAVTSTHSIVEVDDASRESWVSSVSMPTCSGPCDGGGIIQEDEGRVTSRVTCGVHVGEVSATNICTDKGKGLLTDNLPSSKYGSMECSRLPKSGSNFVELERCTGLKSGDSSNSSANFDLIKDCSCSFCLKAAYIWSDLHYQDIKGRISAIKKSQKEAGNLAEKSRHKESNTHGHANPNQSSFLEFDLMGQWRSLFLHMEDAFLTESCQLQDNYRTLKELRENCKTNLETINGMQPDK